MKKSLSILLIAMVAFALVLTGCQKKEVAGSDSNDYKVAIFTGTVSQGEEEFRAGEKLAKLYPNKVVHQTYPDNFSKETETTIATALALVSDPKVKALVMVQAVPGAAAAFEKVREVRPDVLIIAGVPGEDPPVVAAVADISMAGDDLAMGYTIPEQAYKMGAKVFVHYSFPRHMSYALLAQRRDIMKETCERLGMTFVYADAPDPLGDAGLPGAQQFILEDVPRKIAEYGKDTNFFSTNCGMQEPLIKASLEGGAINAQQCCPSPYHGYPGALGIAIPDDKAGDVDYIIDAIKAKVASIGATGRASTWPIPLNMMLVQAGYEYACDFIEGKITSKNDMAAMQRIGSRIAGIDMEFNALVESGTTYPNYYMILSGYITF